MSEHRPVTYDWNLHASDWSPDQIAEWKRLGRAGEPRLQPHAEHEPDECEHCDLLRKWMTEADDQ